MKKTAGNVDVPRTIVVTRPTRSGRFPASTFSVEPDGVHLGWDPVAGAGELRDLPHPDRDVDFGALPVATLTAGTTSRSSPASSTGSSPSAR